MRRMNRPDLPVFRRVLVLHPGALGDILLSIPACRDLKKITKGPLTLAGKIPVLDMLADAGEIDEAFSFDAAWLAELFGPGDELSSDAGERLLRHDLVVSWIGDAGGALSRHIASYPGIRSVIGRPVRSDSIDAPRWTVYRRSLEGIMAHGDPNLSPIKPGPKAVALGVERFRREGLDLSQRLVALHPGAGREAKRWPLEAFASIGRTALDDRMAIVILEGPAEPGLGAALRDRIGGRTCVIAPVNAMELAGILSACSVYIGNDAGPGHLAAALGLKTVIVYTSTDPRVWSPWGPHVVPVSATDDPAAVIRRVMPAIRRREKAI